MSWRSQFSQYHQPCAGVCGFAPCSNDEAAVIGKVGLRVAPALIKTDGPAGSVVDAAGAVGLVLNRFVHFDVRTGAVESMGRLSSTIEEILVLSTL